MGVNTLQRTAEQLRAVASLIVGRSLSRLRTTVTAVRRWWDGLDAAERVLYRAVGLLGAGCGLVWPPLALIVPGVLFAATFFGFSFRRAG